MLRAEDNKFLTESNAGTGMGELLRRFWLPVLSQAPTSPQPPLSGRLWTRAPWRRVPCAICCCRARSSRTFHPTAGDPEAPPEGAGSLSRSSGPKRCSKIILLLHFRPIPLSRMAILRDPTML